MDGPETLARILCECGEAGGGRVYQYSETEPDDEAVPEPVGDCVDRTVYGGGPGTTE